jgi:hypothetical protein
MEILLHYVNRTTRTQTPRTTALPHGTEGILKGSVQQLRLSPIEGGRQRMEIARLLFNSAPIFFFFKLLY